MYANASVRRSAVAHALALALLLAAAWQTGRAPLHAQVHQHPPAASDTAGAHDPAGAEVPHRPMLSLPLGGGWQLVAMAQAFPIWTGGVAPEGGGIGRPSHFYLTQPAAMLDVESPGGGFVFRITPNFEGLLIADGELTLGGWGEGFLDRRHPHAYLHEAMASLILRSAEHDGPPSASISLGRGFVPYGTDDPMSRPVLKYPTNHHLSQILERWTVSGAFAGAGWSIEAGVFGGAEPEDPGDLSNIESFPDSWSVRLRHHGRAAPFNRELGISLASVRERHHGEPARTWLHNVFLRYDAPVRSGRVYALAELSFSRPQEEEGHWSLLGEAAAALGAGGVHRPYVRVELATRPEYAREGAAGEEGFFRYDHGAHPIGATRWLITSAGYGYRWWDGRLGAVHPFVEVQHHRVARERGNADPAALFGGSRLWKVSAGFRVFLGGGPMRMGSYGALDPMAEMRHDM